MNNDLIKLVTSEPKQQQPNIQLVHEITWTEKDFPQIINSAYLSSDLNDLNARNPEQSKEPSRKFLKAYAYLPDLYIYDPVLYNLYKTTSRTDVELLYSLSSYVNQSGKIVDFVLDKQENCFLISSANNEAETAEPINTLQKITPEGKVAFRHHLPVDRLSWEKGVQTFYIKLIFLDETLYVLGRDKKGSYIYKINLPSGKLELVFETPKQLTTIEGINKQIFAVDEEGFAFWLNANGKIIDQDSQYPTGYNNIIGHDKNGHLYSSYDGLACIGRNRGIIWEKYIASFVQENERFYHQDTIGALNSQQQIELSIYQQNDSTPQTFVFPKEAALTAAPYSPLLVNVEHGKVYFRAGKEFNYELYCFDWETQTFIEKTAYTPFNGKRHFLTQMYYPTWTIDQQGYALIPVQGHDKLYIYRVQFS